MGHVWDDAAAIAADNGETMTAYVERALRSANASARRKKPPGH